ncbi:MAG: ATP-binding protein [Longimicrobiales bacterium]|nr:ATP-binding protein [Longimicrobiales bacterium]
MRVVQVPDSLDGRTFEDLVDALGHVEDERALFDARHLRWIDPVGMTGLLAAGVAAAERTGVQPRLEIPESSEVRSYLARMAFFARAAPVFILDGDQPSRSGGASDVLLEVTSISRNSDVHEVVDRVQERAGAILAESLAYPPTAVVQFSVILSEVCQNIVEHADASGWVAAQTYNWTKRLGRNVVVISVVDMGRGFRGSLAPEHASRFGDRWGDATALEAAFIHGITRFPDSGRGQGIQQIRKQVRRWDGMISIRSGTARIADVPDWYDLPPLEEGLAPLGGAQISIVLPARAEDGSGSGGGSAAQPAAAGGF